MVNVIDKKTVLDVNITGKRVFYRVDYNVPITKWEICDDYRIRATFPTLKYMLDSGVSQIIIASHLGRPKGRGECSLYPVYKFLEKEMNLKIEFSSMFGSFTEKIVFLENLRYFEEEKKDLRKSNTNFYKFIEDSADIIVNDGFGVSHRWCGSINGVDRPVIAGLLMKKELEMCSTIDKSDLIILGGKKVGEKLKLIKELIKKTKMIFLAGAMCYPIMKYKYNENIGSNYIEDDSTVVDEIYEEANKYGTKIYIPEDFTCVVEKNTKNIKRNEFKKNYIGSDIGPETLKKLQDLISKAQVIFWNGPPGIFEDEDSSFGTSELVNYLYEADKYNKTVIMGGGDTLSAINKFGSVEDFKHVSTGGGALLAIIEGSSMPGVEAIQELVQ